MLLISSRSSGADMALPQLHVGWLVWGDESGGVATAVLNNARVLKDQGQQIALWCLGPGMLADAALQRGWTVHWLGRDGGLHPRYIGGGFSLFGLLRRMLMVLRLRRMLREGLRKSAPDVLCLPWPDLMPLAGPVARQLGVGLVLEMPNTPSHYPFQLNQRIYAWASKRWRVRILANSAFSASRMQRIPDVAVVTPAVDAARFDPSRVVPILRSELGIPEQAVVLGLIARLDHSKGADLVIAAIALLGAEAEQVHLLVVGGPRASSYAASLRAQVGAAGLAQRVYWVDTVPDPERYWLVCDIAINARRDVEPFGLSIIEAMLMARPVLAHSLGQPGATVDEGRTGWLYHRPEPAALAEAIQHALAYRAQWSTMGRLARAEALRRFASSAAGAHYLQILRLQAAQVHMPTA